MSDSNNTNPVLSSLLETYEKGLQATHMYEFFWSLLFFFTGLILSAFARKWRKCTLFILGFVVSIGTVAYLNSTGAVTRLIENIGRSMGCGSSEFMQKDYGTQYERLDNSMKEQTNGTASFKHILLLCIGLAGGILSVCFEKFMASALFGWLFFMIATFSWPYVERAIFQDTVSDYNGVGSDSRMEQFAKAHRERVEEGKTSEDVKIELDKDGSESGSTFGADFGHFAACIGYYVVMVVVGGLIGFCIFKKLYKILVPIIGAIIMSDYFVHCLLLGFILCNATNSTIESIGLSTRSKGLFSFHQGLSPLTTEGEGITSPNKNSSRSYEALDKLLWDAKEKDGSISSSSIKNQIRDSKNANRRSFVEYMQVSWFTHLIHIIMLVVGLWLNCKCSGEKKKKKDSDDSSSDSDEEKRNESDYESSDYYD